MTRKYVTENLGSMQFDGALDEIVDRLTQLKTQHPKHRKFRLETEWNYDSSTIYLYAERDETDAEMQVREKAEAKTRLAAAKARQRRDERDAAEYERLKKKFGG
jgi:hypothetical protein